MNRTVALLALAVALAGCSGSAPREAEDGEYDPRTITYYRDDRTKLCFAVAAYDRRDQAFRSAPGMSHAHVPCTDEVVRLLRK